MLRGQREDVYYYPAAGAARGKILFAPGDGGWRGFAIDIAQTLAGWGYAAYLTYVEVATGPMVIRLMDEGGFDLVILDGEATPTGGMGIAKQLKDEIADCPPVLVITGRPDDAWLASWSRAEAAVPHPIDPIRLGDAVAGLLRAPVQ